MNRIGMLIDLSHVGRRARLEAIEASADPVIFSHSNPRALHGNPRNISDEQMRACAAKGGVVGLATFSAFVGDTSDGRHPGLDDYFRQMDHVLDLIGPAHVGIGTDIFLDPTDGVWWRAVTGRLYPEVSQGMTYETHNIEGFMHYSDFPSVAESMLRHGYDEPTVRQILGGNWRRVYSQVWDAPTARPAQNGRPTYEAISQGTPPARRRVHRYVPALPVRWRGRAVLRRARL
jgi:membrane dipeptidase